LFDVEPGGAFASGSEVSDVGGARVPCNYILASRCVPRGSEMPNYITLGNWTEQGIKNVKESPKRADAVSALANKLGAKMQIFYTMGRYDIVALTEAPNDDVAMQLLLEIGKLGNVKTQTLKAWTTSEATKVISKISP
jgi:uncharacterized protein with GYD domain